MLGLGCLTKLRCCLASGIGQVFVQQQMTWQITCTTAFSSIEQSKEVSVSTNNEQPAPSVKKQTALPSDKNTEESANKKKFRKTRKKNMQTHPRLPHKKIRNLNSIASIVTTVNEISCVSMTKDFELTAVATKACQKMSALQMVEMGRSIISGIGDVDMTIMELVKLPPSYNFINIQNRSLAMLFMALLNNAVENVSVVQIYREAVGEFFGLDIRQADARLCSQKLVHEIVNTGLWNSKNVHIPEHTLYAYDGLVYYGSDTDKSGLKISPETGDAFLQAIGAWSHFHETLNKKNNSTT